MAAHLRSIVRKCNRCEKPAIVELRNTHNAVIGEFCRKHGAEALKGYQQRYEKDD
jgi:hypothetical protein